MGLFSSIASRAKAAAKKAAQRAAQAAKAAAIKAEQTAEKSASKLFALAGFTVIPEIGDMINISNANKYGDLLNKASSTLKNSPDAIGMLGLSMGIETPYNKNISKTFSSYKNAKVNGNDYSSYFKNKLDDQLDDYSVDTNKVKGYYFDSNSEPSKNIAKEDSFVEFLKKNQKKLDKVSPEKPLNFEFKKTENENLYYALHNTQIIDSWVDDDGYTHIMLADTYDFNKNDKNPLTQLGSNAMDAGMLNPYFTMHEVKVKL